MQTFLTIAIILVCVLLILVVLIQNSKGGGISSQFSAANQIMGARRGTDVVEKATWTLAILLLVLSLLSTPKNTTAAETDTQNSVTKTQANPNNAPGGVPAPMQMPSNAQPAAGTPTP
jgi:preprotein translocase subunit SecG